jgi:hypothetical protein
MHPRANVETMLMVLCLSFTSSTKHHGVVTEIEAQVNPCSYRVSINPLSGCFHPESPAVSHAVTHVNDHCLITAP